MRHFYSAFFVAKSLLLGSCGGSDTQRVLATSFDVAILVIVGQIAIFAEAF